jgi:hypothetical protein
MYTESETATVELDDVPTLLTYLRLSDVSTVHGDELQAVSFALGGGPSFGVTSVGAGCTSNPVLSFPVLLLAAIQKKEFKP